MHPEPKKYLKITERNSWERETWRFYLPYNAKDKNQQRLLRLAKKFKPGGFTFETISKQEFQKLDFDNCRVGYMSALNYVTKPLGTIRVKDKEELWSFLYKGGIQAYWLRSKKSFERFGDEELVATLKNLLLDEGFDIGKGYLSVAEVEALSKISKKIKKKWASRETRWRNSDKTGVNDYFEFRKRHVFRQDAGIFWRAVFTASESKSKLYIE